MLQSFGGVIMVKEWLQSGIHQVNALLNIDEDHQELLKRLDLARESYEAAVNGLTATQRQQIEDYIALCEELEYQKTYTAYYCGKRNG